jgi:hypothetical protein
MAWITFKRFKALFHDLNQPARSQNKNWKKSAYFTHSSAPMSDLAATAKRGVKRASIDAESASKSGVAQPETKPARPVTPFEASVYRLSKQVPKGSGFGPFSAFVCILHRGRYLIYYFTPPSAL